MYHGLADALPLHAGRDRDILDDRRRRSEMAEIVHHQEREGADDVVAALGDVERVVGIVGKALVQPSGGLHRQHNARVELGLGIEIEHLAQIGRRRRTDHELGLIKHGASPPLPWSSVTTSSR